MLIGPGERIAKSERVGNAFVLCRCPCVDTARLANHFILSFRDTSGKAIIPMCWRPNPPPRLPIVAFWGKLLMRFSLSFSLLSSTSMRSWFFPLNSASDFTCSLFSLPLNLPQQLHSPWSSFMNLAGDRAPGAPGGKIQAWLHLPWWLGLGQDKTDPAEVSWGRAQAKKHQEAGVISPPHPARKGYLGRCSRSQRRREANDGELDRRAQKYAKMDCQGRSKTRWRSPSYQNRGCKCCVGCKLCVGRVAVWILLQPEWAMLLIFLTCCLDSANYLSWRVSLSENWLMINKRHEMGLSSWPSFHRTYEYADEGMFLTFLRRCESLSGPRGSSALIQASCDHVKMPWHRVVKQVDWLLILQQ